MLRKMIAKIYVIFIIPYTKALVRCDVLHGYFEVAFIYRKSSINRVGRALVIFGHPSK